MEATIWAIDWHAMLRLERSLLEVVLRGTIMYFVIVAMLRIAAKRQSGMIANSDILVIVLIAEIAGPGMTAGSVSIVEGAVLIATVLGWGYVVDRLAYRFPAIEHALDPRPVALIEDGQMIERNMKRELVTRDELVTHLRKQGIVDISEVGRACMEADGMISIVKRGTFAALARG